MAKRSNFLKSGTLSMAQQIGRMSTLHPGFHAALKRNVAEWDGELKPSAVSSTYNVKISYTREKRPTVWVLNPALHIRTKGEKIPHTFPNGTVCLHRHEDWTSRMFISDTIVPWLSLWLYHYEVWHATGVWYGGGDEPTLKK
jgi:hypothetical protein